MTMPSTQQRLRAAVAEEVRALLARRRISSVKLAAQIGRSQAYVSRRLNGDVAFDLDDLENIARVLRVRVTDLVPERAIETTSDQPGGSIPWYDHAGQAAIDHTPDRA